MQLGLYPGSEVPLQRKRRKDPLVAHSEAFQMIGPIKLSHFTGGIRSDEHRTQTTLKRAGCFDDKKYFRCAALVNQVHTSIVSKKFRHEEQPKDTPNNSSVEQSLKLLNYALVVSTDVQSWARFSWDEKHTLYFHTVIIRISWWHVHICHLGLVSLLFKIAELR